MIRNSWGSARRLVRVWYFTDVLPMPGLIKIGAKAEALSITNEPTVNRGLDLERTVGVLGLDRIAADIQIKSPTGKMRAVDCQAGPPNVR